MTYRDLSDIKSDLDRLDLELIYLKDELNALDWESEELEASSKNIFDDDKKLLLKSAEQ